MDHLPLPAPASQGAGAGRLLDSYKTALATAASAAAYAVMARSMARELLPEELRAAARWCADQARARFGRGGRERHTVVIRPQSSGGYSDNHLFDAARAYLATRIDPRAVRRLSLALSRHVEPDGAASWSTILSMEPGGSTVDHFDGAEFTWTSVESGVEDESGAGRRGGGPRENLELSFDAEHADVAVERYVPFVISMAEQLQLRDRALRIFMNEGQSWYGINHHHPATFDTLAMDPALKQSVIADLDRFLGRKDYYRRIGKAWKRGYLLYGPPGTGKSSLVAAMANHLRFNLYDLDLSVVRFNSALQKLLVHMPNKSILVIEDIDCSFEGAASREREDGKAAEPDLVFADELCYGSDGCPPAAYYPGAAPAPPNGITLSGLLNFIDGLWSTCGEERIIVFTTNYKDRLDSALLRPGRMDMHVYMGYCGWEAFKTLARNYFLVDNHALFPEIQELLSAVEVTPGEVSEMLLRSEDVDVALRALAEFLQMKGRRARNRRQNKKGADGKGEASGKQCKLSVEMGQSISDVISSY